jgi:hypothetical protein
LSNHPPTLISAQAVNPNGPVYKNGDRVEIETVWNSPDTLLKVSADFASIDSRFDTSGVTLSRFTGNRYRLGYTINDGNENQDAEDYIVTLMAKDNGCGASSLEPFIVALDNTAGSRPLLDPLPSTTRQPSISVSGSAPASARVEIRRDGILAETADVATDGRFGRSVPLDPGDNTLTAEGFDLAGNKTPPSISATVFRVTGAAITVPARFLPGSTIQIELGRTGRNARVELWNLSGDLIAVIENDSPQDLYRMVWDGRSGSGQAVNSGPIVSKIDITYADGSHETMRRAFVLVAR